MPRPIAPRPITHSLALAAVIGVLVTGCSTTPGEPVTSPSQQPPRSTPSQQPPAPSVAPSPVPPEIVARAEVQEAIRAEAERHGVDPASVSVVSYEAVTWPDGSLGCPEPGKMYTQALVEGHRLVLSVGGEEASYHSGNAGTFQYCANPSLETPGHGRD